MKIQKWPEVHNCVCTLTPFFPPPLLPFSVHFLASCLHPLSLASRRWGKVAKWLCVGKRQLGKQLFWSSSSTGIMWSVSLTCLHKAQISFSQEGDVEAFYRTDLLGSQKWPTASLGILSPQILAELLWF